MVLKINCIHNKDNAWCTNKNIKKSFWGLGARCCVEHQDKICELKQKKQRNEFKVRKCIGLESEQERQNKIKVQFKYYTSAPSLNEIIHKIDNNTINKCRNSKSDAEFRRYLKEWFKNYNK